MTVDKTIDVVRLIRLQQRVRILEKFLFSSDQRALTKLHKVFFIDPDSSGDSSSSSEEEINDKKATEKDRVLKKSEGFGLRSKLDVAIWDSLWSKRIRRNCLTTLDDNICTTENNLMDRVDKFDLQKIDPNPKLQMQLDQSELEVNSVSTTKFYSTPYQNLQYNNEGNTAYKNSARDRGQRNLRSAGMIVPRGNRVSSAGTNPTMAPPSQTSYVVSVKTRPMDNAPIEDRLVLKSAAKIEVGSVVSVDSENDINELVGQGNTEIGFSNAQMDVFEYHVEQQFKVDEAKRYFADELPDLMSSAPINSKIQEANQDSRSNFEVSDR